MKNYSENKIKFFAGLIGDENLLDKYRKTIDSIIDSDDATSILKKKGEGIYTARVDKKIRLFFGIHEHKDGQCLVLLDVMLDHKYNSNNFMDKHYVKKYWDMHKEKYNLLINTNGKDKSVHEVSRKKLRFVETYKFNQKYLQFNEEQLKSISMPTPMVMVGLPGSGKSCLALCMLSKFYAEFAALKKKNKKVLVYIAKHPYLVKHMESIWTDKYATNINVQFKTWNEILGSEMANKMYVDFENFKSWLQTSTCNRINNINPKKLAKIDDIYKECQLRVNTPEKANTDIGKRSLLFTEPEEKKWITELSVAYQKYLELHNLMDPGFIKNDLKDINFQYDAIVFDEAHQVSLQEHIKAYNLVKNKKIVLFMDPHQIVNNNFYFVADLLIDRIPNFTRVDLIKNYRCSPNIWQLANKVQSMIKLLTRHKADNDQGINCYDSLESNQTELSIRWDLSISTNYHECITKASKNHTFAIIVPDNMPEIFSKAQEKFPEAADSVYTVSNAMGLEFEMVVLFNFMATPGLKSANKCLEKLSNHQSIIKEDNNNLRLILNSLYVAVTRAKNTVWFCDFNTQELAYVKDFFVERKPVKEVEATQITVTSTQKDWLKFVERHLLENNISKAKALYYAHINSDEKAFNAYQKRILRPTITITPEKISPIPKLAPRSLSSPTNKSTLFAQSVTKPSPMSNKEINEIICKVTNDFATFNYDDIKEKERIRTRLINIFKKPASLKLYLFDGTSFNGNTLFEILFLDTRRGGCLFDFLVLEKDCPNYIKQFPTENVKQMLHKYLLKDSITFKEMRLIYLLILYHPEFFNYLNLPVIRNILFTLIPITNNKEGSITLFYSLIKHPTGVHSLINYAKNKHEPFKELTISFLQSYPYTMDTPQSYINILQHTELGKELLNIIAQHDFVIASSPQCFPEKITSILANDYENYFKYPSDPFFISSIAYTIYNAVNQPEGRKKLYEFYNSFIYRNPLALIPIKILFSDIGNYPFCELVNFFDNLKISGFSLPLSEKQNNANCCEHEAITEIVDSLSNNFLQEYIKNNYPIKPDGENIIYSLIEDNYGLQLLKLIMITDSSLVKYIAPHVFKIKVYKENYRGIRLEPFFELSNSSQGIVCLYTITQALKKQKLVLPQISPEQLLTRYISPESPLHTNILDNLRVSLAGGIVLETLIDSNPVLEDINNFSLTKIFEFWSKRFEIYVQDNGENLLDIVDSLSGILRNKNGLFILGEYFFNRFTVEYNYEVKKTQPVVQKIFDFLMYPLHDIANGYRIMFRLIENSLGNKILMNLLEKFPDMIYCFTKEVLLMTVSYKKDSLNLLNALLKNENTVKILISILKNSSALSELPKEVFLDPQPLMHSSSLDKLSFVKFLSTSILQYKKGPIYNLHHLLLDNKNKYVFACPGYIEAWKTLKNLEEKVEFSNGSFVLR